MRDYVLYLLIRATLERAVQSQGPLTNVSRTMLQLLQGRWAEVQKGVR